LDGVIQVERFGPGVSGDAQCQNQDKRGSPH
jgi:hypothetical protein